MANPGAKIKKDDKATMVDGFKNYFKGVKAEWGKVTWPEKHQIIVETGIVLFVVIAFTVIVYLMDIIFKGLLGLIPLR
ncbi:MAG: preprotein translocase subunit SecE [Candidatus Gastranaerophilales bacterium]|nr:preprotein translocase subunit SecE [Candidatus Gastranaerophilales bacterium]